MSDGRCPPCRRHVTLCGVDEASAQPQVIARCQDCQAAVQLPMDDHDCLVTFRRFLDAHDRCVFNVTLETVIDLDMDSTRRPTATTAWEPWP